MILPIIAYGHPVLKKVCAPIEQGNVQIEELIANMWETMYNAKGVGLAGPQVGVANRIFLIDTLQLKNEENEDGIKQVFLNAKILSEEGEPWVYEEGCLSIPKLVGDVERQELVTIKYEDETFKEHTMTFSGMNARVIQHEYDHIEGILFTERLKPLKRRLIARKLEQIKKGNIELDYRMKFKS